MQQSTPLKNPYICIPHIFPTSLIYAFWCYSKLSYFFFTSQSNLINSFGLVVIQLYLNWFLLSASKIKASLGLVFSFLNFGVSWVNFISGSSASTPSLIGEVHEDPKLPTEQISRRFYELQRVVQQTRQFDICTGEVSPDCMILTVRHYSSVLIKWFLFNNAEPRAIDALVNNNKCNSQQCQGSTGALYLDLLEKYMQHWRVVRSQDTKLELRLLYRLFGVKVLLSWTNWRKSRMPFQRTTLKRLTNLRTVCKDSFIKQDRETSEVNWFDITHFAAAPKWTGSCPFSEWSFSLSFNQRNLSPTKVRGKQCFCCM